MRQNERIKRGSKVFTKEANPRPVVVLGTKGRSLWEVQFVDPETGTPIEDLTEVRKSQQLVKPKENQEWPVWEKKVTQEESEEEETVVNNNDKSSTDGRSASSRSTNTSMNNARNDNNSESDNSFTFSVADEDDESDKDLGGDELPTNIDDEIEVNPNDELDDEMEAKSDDELEENPDNEMEEDVAVDIDGILDNGDEIGVNNLRMGQQVEQDNDKYQAQTQKYEKEKQLLIKNKWSVATKAAKTSKLDIGSKVKERRGLKRVGVIVEDSRLEGDKQQKWKIKFKDGTEESNVASTRLKQIKDDRIFTWTICEKLLLQNPVVDFREIGVVGFDFKKEFSDAAVSLQNEDYDYPYKKLFDHMWPGKKTKICLYCMDVFNCYLTLLLYFRRQSRTTCKPKPRH